MKSTRRLRSWLRLCAALAATITASRHLHAAGAAGDAAPAGARALVLVLGDQHSAYERTAQLVAHVDRLRAAHPTLPLAILIDGDSLEYGNIVARRSEAAIDLAMFAAFARRAPTVLNLGNHEADFLDFTEAVARLRATGITVIGNLHSRVTGEPFAPAWTTLPLGAHEAVIAGLATDRLTTYRAAVRPGLDLAEPVAWGARHFPRLLDDAPLPIVLSHAGIRADRELLALVPPGTLFAGAHNHVRFVHEAPEDVVYFHSGSWNDTVSLAWLVRAPTAGATPRWQVQQLPISSADPADPELAALIRETEARHLTPEDLAPVGRLPAALAPAEAARFVAATLRDAAGVDAAFVGNTTFGAGLPAGDVTRVALDACVRFDGTIFTAEVDGARLRALLAAANQDAATPFAERHGEFLVAAGPPPAEIADDRHYTIATTDWGARNTATYFGAPEITWSERPALRLKAAVIERLDRPSPPPAR